MLRIENMKLLNGRLVNFTLKENDAVIIRGDNGTGKSLFLKSLARLIPSTYSIFDYNGKSVSTYVNEVFRSEVLYVSTTPSSLSQGTVEDYFRSALDLEIYSNYQVTFPYNDYLIEWKLDHLPFSQLSSGQKQMISILRALSLKARILLLDEPTANLDANRTHEIEKLLLDWMKKTSGSVIMVCHSDEQTRRLGFRTISF
jgi:putative ABC transport system ATP-binding protein